MDNDVVSVDARRVTDGRMMYRAVTNFQKLLRVGDRLMVPTDDCQVGMRNDYGISRFMEFTVFRKYPHCVELHHTNPARNKGYVHVYSPGYITLYCLTGGRIVRDDAEASNRSLLLGGSELQGMFEGELVQSIPEEIQY